MQGFRFPRSTRGIRRRCIDALARWSGVLPVDVPICGGTTGMQLPSKLPNPDDVMLLPDDEQKF